jgi:hypothetical protein
MQTVNVAIEIKKNIKHMYKNVYSKRILAETALGNGRREA